MHWFCSLSLNMFSVSPIRIDNPYDGAGLQYNIVDFFTYGCYYQTPRLHNFNVLCIYMCIQIPLSKFIFPMVLCCHELRSGELYVFGACVCLVKEYCYLTPFPCQLFSIFMAW